MKGEKEVGKEFIYSEQGELGVGILIDGGSTFPPKTASMKKE